jgi:hypothetical protein
MVLAIHFDGCPEDFKAYLAFKDKLYKLKKFAIQSFAIEQ